MAATGLASPVHDSGPVFRGTTMAWWLWLLVGLALLGIEMITPGGFFTIFFGVAALIVGVLTRFGRGRSGSGSRFCRSPPCSFSASRFSRGCRPGR